MYFYQILKDWQVLVFNMGSHGRVLLIAESRAYFAALLEIDKRFLTIDIPLKSSTCKSLIVTLLHFSNCL